jgi:hypothetical protein
VPDLAAASRYAAVTLNVVVQAEHVPELVTHRFAVRRFKSCQPDSGKPQLRGRIRRDPERPLAPFRGGLTTIGRPPDVADGEDGICAGRRGPGRPAVS